MKRNILLFLCAFLATIGVCAGVFMLLKHRANLQAEEAAAQAAATATPAPAPAPTPTEKPEGEPEPTPAPVEEPTPSPTPEPAVEPQPAPAETEPAPTEEPAPAPAAETPKAADSRAAKYVAALGGKENLRVVDACATRLRLEVNDPALVQDATLKQLGARGVVRVGANSVQVVIGPEADLISTEIKEII